MKKVDQIRQLYNLSNTWTRKQWEQVNQKGYDFAHDEQLTQDAWNHIVFYYISADTSPTSRIRNKDVGTIYVDDFTLRKISGYPGLLVNMEATDFSGETP